MTTIGSGYSLLGTVAKALTNPIGAIKNVLNSHDVDQIKTKQIFV